MASKYYAVRVGRRMGIYADWDECKAQVNGYPNATYKSFKSYQDAVDYMSGDTNKNQNIIKESEEIPQALASEDGDNDLPW